MIFFPLKAIVILFLFFVSSLGNCRLFELRITNYGTHDPTLTAMIDSLVGDIESKIATENNTTSIDVPKIRRHLKGFGDSNNMTTKGIDPFYANNFKFFGFGLKTALGADLGDQSFNNLLNSQLYTDKFNAAAFNPRLVFAFKKKDTTYVIQGAYLDNKFFKNGARTKHINVGISVQNILIPPIKTPLEFFIWNGVDWNIGFNHTFLDMSYTKEFSTSAQKSLTHPSLPSSSTVDVTARIVGPATIGLKSSLYSIPAEISTGYTLANSFSQYLGLGLDINSGKTQTYAHASPDVVFNSSQPLIVFPIVQTEVNFLANETEKLDLLSFRYFTGMSFQAGPVGIFMNFNKSLLLSIFSFSLGFKFLI